MLPWLVCVELDRQGQIQWKDTSSQKLRILAWKCKKFTVGWNHYHLQTRHQIHQQEKSSSINVLPHKLVTGWPASLWARGLGPISPVQLVLPCYTCTWCVFGGRKAQLRGAGDGSIADRFFRDGWKPSWRQRQGDSVAPLNVEVEAQEMGQCWNFLLQLRLVYKEEG